MSHAQLRVGERSRCASRRGPGGHVSRYCCLAHGECLRVLGKRGKRGWIVRRKSPLRFSEGVLRLAPGTICVLVGREHGRDPHYFHPT